VMLRMLKIARGRLPCNHFSQQTCGLERFAVSSAYWWLGNPSERSASG